MVYRSQRKNERSKPEISIVFIIGAIITGILGFMTPLVSFGAGVFGFCVLFAFASCALVDMRFYWHPLKLILLVIVLAVSWRLIWYAGILGFISIFGCNSCFA